MEDNHHLFRFTPEFTAFDGWRLAVTVRGLQLVRYFSSLQYGGERAAHAEARRVRDALLADLSRDEVPVSEVFARYLPVVNRLFPLGVSPLRPERGAEVVEPERRVCSLRFNRVMAQVCRRLQLLLGMDLSSVLRLALFVFAVDVFCRLAAGEEGLAGDESLPEDVVSATQPVRLERVAVWLTDLVAGLDARANEVDLPCFECFATGKKGR